MHRYTRRVLRVLRIGVVLLISVVVLLRFVNPPTTALMGIRSLEYWWAGKQVNTRWEWRSLAHISPHLKRGVVAAEDGHFWEHHGIDVESLWSVVSRETKRRRIRGASTIPMQVVKNLFLWPGRNYVRKGIEIVVAPVLDLVWGKERLLEVYLNVVEWGEGVYGCEAAAQLYYGTSASQLTRSQAAALAATLPSPRKTSPRALSTAAKRRFSRIYREMG